MKYNTLIIPIIFLLLLGSCKNDKPSPIADKAELIAVDKKFSDFSARYGFQAAFIEFADTDAVLLRPESLPVKSKSSIMELFASRSDSTILLTWEPDFAAIAGSGDLGYTYGIFTAKLKNDSLSVGSKGTYLTIWKKQAGGGWKFVLDTGNDGLGNESEKSQ